MGNDSKKLRRRLAKKPDNLFCKSVVSRSACSIFVLFDIASNVDDVVDSHIQRVVLATEETTVTQ